MIGLLTFAFALLLVAGSCKAKKAESSRTEQFVNTSSSTVKEVNTNAAILDSLKIYVEKIRTSKPECDSVCQIEFDRLLSQLNNHKQSGDNSFGVYYDKYKKLLVAYGTLAATVNSVETASENRDRFFLKETKVPVPAEFTQEQNINIWVGRLFWLLLFAWIIIRFKR